MAGDRPRQPRLLRLTCISWALLRILV